MKLQYEVKTLDGVPEAARAHYTKIKNGYRLELIGHETAEQMREAMHADKTATATANEKIRALELQSWKDEGEARRQREEHAAAITAPARHPDDERLEREYTDKINAHEAELKAQVASLRADRDETALERTAVEIASRLAVPGSVDLLLPHIRQRLAATDTNGVFAVTARDAPSLEHLVESFRADPRFSRVLNGMSTVDKALHQRRVNETLGVTATAQGSITRAEFERLSPVARAAHARAGGRIVDG